MIIFTTNKQKVLQCTTVSDATFLPLSQGSKHSLALASRQFSTFPPEERGGAAGTRPLSPFHSALVPFNADSEVCDRFFRAVATEFDLIKDSSCAPVDH